jgi:hypothetical protein
MVFAKDMHLLNEAIEACDEIYPSIMEVIKRMLPTYPQHAARRCEELQEVEETMLISGLTPRIVCAVREVTSALATAGLTDHGPRQWTVAEMIREVHKEGILLSVKPDFPQFPEQRDKNGSVSGDQPVTTAR